ncbi:hypothetical protein C8T65DRAFT_741056 [Cerioporus squamosus]|nr:hypothetical protein C8T65DRAFT_741056 [Cerioporus squamosus]
MNPPASAARSLHGSSSSELKDLPATNASPGNTAQGAADPNFKGVNSAVAVTPGEDSSPTHDDDLTARERESKASSPAHPSAPPDSSPPSSPTHGHGLHVTLDRDAGSSPSSPTHGHGLHVLDDSPPSSPTHGHGLHVRDDSDTSSPTHGHELHVLVDAGSTLGQGVSPTAGGENIRRAP